MTHVGNILTRCIVASHRSIMAQTIRLLVDGFRYCSPESKYQEERLIPGAVAASIEEYASMSMNIAPRPRRRDAFTLVELLTVIAIIAILAAIIFPVFAEVRNATR